MNELVALIGRQLHLSESSLCQCQESTAPPLSRPSQAVEKKNDNALSFPFPPPAHVQQLTSPRPGEQRNRENSHSQPSTPGPHFPSRFLACVITGKKARCLIDTGCPYNIMSKHFFDRLPMPARSAILERPAYETLHGRTLDSYGTVSLYLKTKRNRVVASFVVGQINEDVILGNPFLEQNKCVLQFDHPQLTLKGERIACTDRKGKSLVISVQVVQDDIIVPGQERVVLGRITRHTPNNVGLIEGCHATMWVAASVNQLAEQNRVWVWYLNPGQDDIFLKAGTVIGTYTALNDTDIECLQETPSERIRSVNTDSRNLPLPSHMLSLYNDGRQRCETKEQKSAYKHLLNRHQQAFARSKGDLGKTPMIQHSILVEEGTRPIRLHPQ